jgi:hypothetical protein
MKTNSSTSESDPKTLGKREQSQEHAPKEDAGDSESCRLDVKLDEQGNIELIGMTACCPRILNKLPPIRKEFWLRRSKSELREEIQERRGDKAAQKGRK